MTVKKLKYKLGENALKSVLDQTDHDAKFDRENWTSKGKSKSLVIVKPEPPSLFFMSPVIHKEKIYTQFLPEPPSLFLQQAKDFSLMAHNIANQFKNNIEKRLSNQGEDQLYMVTEDLYYSFLSYKISSLTSIVMFIESFVNSLIPEDFEILNKKNEKVGKHDIERFWSLKSKLKTIIPEVRVIDDSENYRVSQDRFLKLNVLRNNFIHLKSTRDQKNMDPYIIHFEEIINLNLSKAIEQTEELAGIIDPTYFK